MLRLVAINGELVEPADAKGVKRRPARAAPRGEDARSKRRGRRGGSDASPHRHSLRAGREPVWRHAEHEAVLSRLFMIEAILDDAMGRIDELERG